MDAGTTNNPLLPLETEDPQIEQCLSTLSTQWATWLEAMQTAQKSLQSGCARCAATESENASSVDASTVDAAELPAEAPVAPATSASGTFIVDPAAQVFATSDEPEASNRATASSPATEAQNSDATAQDTQDDEELLASLDEDTANAIRVKRRLGHQDKSVRELLDSMEPIKPRDDEPQQDKKWWRRSNS